MQLVTNERYILFVNDLIILLKNMVNIDSIMNNITTGCNLSFHFQQIKWILSFLIIIFGRSVSCHFFVCFRQLQAKEVYKRKSRSIWVKLTWKLKQKMIEYLIHSFLFQFMQQCYFFIQRLFVCFLFFYLFFYSYVHWFICFFINFWSFFIILYLFLIIFLICC